MALDTGTVCVSICRRACGRGQQERACHRTVSSPWLFMCRAVVRKLVLTRRDFHPAWPHVAPFEVEYTRPLTETVLLGHEIEALTVSLPSHVSNQSPPFLN